MRSLHWHHHYFISFMKLILLISFTLRAFESLAFIAANIIIAFLLIITLSTFWLVITVFYIAYLFTITIFVTFDSTYLFSATVFTFISSFTLKIIIIFVFVHTFLFIIRSVMTIIWIDMRHLLVLVSLHFVCLDMMITIAWLLYAITTCQFLYLVFIADQNYYSPSYHP